MPYFYNILGYLCVFLALIAFAAMPPARGWESVGERRENERRDDAIKTDAKELWRLSDRVFALEARVKELEQGKRP